MNLRALKTSSLQRQRRQCKIKCSSKISFELANAFRQASPWQKEIMSVKKLSLADWIEQTGVETICKALKVTEGAVRHWKKGHVLPRASYMMQIEKLSRGAVHIKDVVAHHFSDENKKNRWEKLK